VFLAWQPLTMDLFRGQMMLTILLLLTLTWLAFRSRQDVKAGIFLGVALTLKFYGWPILLLFILTRRWKAVFASASLFVFCNVLMALWLGLDVLRNYVQNVAPGIAQIWVTDLYNFSVLSVGYRLFGQAGSISFFIVALLLSVCAALKAQDEDHSFMVMIAASTVLAPISWIHYFVTLLPALCLVASHKKFESTDTIFALAVAVILFLGYVPLDGSAILGALPLFGVAGLIWFLQKRPVRNRQTEMDATSSASFAQKVLNPRLRSVWEEMFLTQRRKVAKRNP
jgi:hypothetical protein